MGEGMREQVFFSVRSHRVLIDGGSVISEPCCLDHTVCLDATVRENEARTPRAL